LYEALRELPSKAYTKHLNYVQQKVNANLYKYRMGNFSGISWTEKTSDYRNKIFDPVVDEIKQLEEEKNTYNVPTTFNSDLSSLKNKWEGELKAAIYYFRFVST
jgi:hypothetical protein